MSSLQRRCNCSIFIYFIMCMIQCYKVYGRRTSNSKGRIEDPKKSILMLERDIFLVSTEPSTPPTSRPSLKPSFQPSREASSYPSYYPTSNPTDTPTSQPTLLPTLFPSMQPSPSPSSIPTTQSSFKPSVMPSNVPSSIPTPSPSSEPSQLPSNLPSLPTLTISPTELFPLSEAPDLDDPRSRSFFNYNPYDTHYGPGQANQKVYYFNKTIGNISTEQSYVYTDYDGNAWSSVRNSKESQYHRLL